jgi:hypothetical protein
MVKFAALVLPQSVLAQEANPGKLPRMAVEDQEHNSLLQTKKQVIEPEVDFASMLQANAQSKEIVEYAWTNANAMTLPSPGQFSCDLSDSTQWQQFSILSGLGTFIHAPGAWSDWELGLWQKPGIDKLYLCTDAPSWDLYFSSQENWVCPPDFVVQISSEHPNHQWCEYAGKRDAYLDYNDQNVAHIVLSTCLAAAWSADQDPATYCSEGYTPEEMAACWNCDEDDVKDCDDCQVLDRRKNQPDFESWLTTLHTTIHHLGLSNTWKTDHFSERCATQTPITTIELFRNIKSSTLVITDQDINYDKNNHDNLLKMNGATSCPIIPQKMNPPIRASRSEIKKAFLNQCVQKDGTTFTHHRGDCLLVITESNKFHTVNQFKQAMELPILGENYVNVLIQLIESLIEKKKQLQEKTRQDTYANKMSDWITKSFTAQKKAVPGKYSQAVSSAQKNAQAASDNADRYQTQAHGYQKQADEFQKQAYEFFKKFECNTPV